jgi:6-pyruvoyltetrahydropterin/6-carboxytetrahydropterin synthase
MYSLEKKFTFEAGHSLLYHDGQCRDPHGHSYGLTIEIRSDQLHQEGPKKNMVCDFADLSKVVKPMIFEYLDHKWLNDTLECDSPTAEFIAKWIFDYLKPKLPHLYSVSVHETATSRATWVDHIS